MAVTWLAYLLFCWKLKIEVVLAIAVTVATLFMRLMPSCAELSLTENEA